MAKIMTVPISYNDNKCEMCKANKILFTCWTINYSIIALNELSMRQIDQTTVGRYQEKHALLSNLFILLNVY